MLSLALIVKNEEKNLARCLDSVAGLWDELVIVDTGSTDRTREIAKKYTDKIYHFEWVDHFAKARNFSFSKCTKPWIMWIDADDVLKPEDVKNIREQFLNITATKPHVDYILINYHYWVNPPTLNGAPLATQLRERIIRKEKGIWRGRCHEHIMINWSRSEPIKDAYVWHLRDAMDVQMDQNRNIKLMKLAVKEDPSARNHFYLGDEYKGAGQLDDAIEIYRKAYEMATNPDLLFQAAWKVGSSYRDKGKKELAGVDDAKHPGIFRNNKNFNKALYWLKKSLEHHIAYREPLLAMADIYTGREDFSKAAFWIETALLIEKPKNPAMCILDSQYTHEPYHTLSQAYFKMQKFDKAVEASRKLYDYTKVPHLLEDISLIKAAKRRTYKRPEGTVRLNLGSGSKTIDGFINCDLFPSPGVDELFSMDDIPYADCSVDEISSEHALEHLPRLEGEKSLKEMARVLKKGGKLTLKVPDLEECCRMFLKRPDLQDSWYMHTLYGVQDFRDDPNNVFPDKVNYGQIHYTGFTEQRLRRLLMESGFLIDRIWKYDGYDTPSLGVEAHMPNIPEDQIKRIAFINNTLIPKYLSYGDYWVDAFKASGHSVTEYRYEDIPTLPDDYDIYFFIEAGYRYRPEAIPAGAHPRVIYTQENTPSEQLQHFDLIATPYQERAESYGRLGHAAVVLPNNNHLQQVNTMLNLDIESLQAKNLVPVETNTAVVDIVIPSYKNCQYLKLAIESVRRNTESYNLIVVNSGDDEETRDWLQQQTDIQLIDSAERLSFSQAVNKGLGASSNDVVILNNDVIVGKDWLEHYRNSPYDITNPYSNCDVGWIHERILTVEGVDLEPNMFLEDVNVDALYETTSPHTDNISRPWVAFYATYIRRKVIEATGLLDEKFINGGEDFDYCRRATKHGFTCGHVFSSWVFHFGGKTRKVSEDENFVQHHKEDELNLAYMNHKTKETVVMYTGPAWESWTINNINTTGIGGSETCAAMLSKKFVEKGYRCILIGDCEGLEGDYDGVEYLHHTQFEEFKQSNHVDYFISSRKVGPLSHQIQNTKNYVWSHDIFIPECYGRYPPYAERVTKFICLSPWHVDFFNQHHGVDKSDIYIQGNGLDLSRYDKRHEIEKDPYRLIYSSSPDRGLIHLLRMVPRWRAEFPELNLHVFYGFDNWKKAVKHRNNPAEIAHMEEVERGLEQPGVTFHGRISQKQLAEEQMKSSLWVYPTEFTETYCITSDEAMLSGCVPVCTSVAALATTVPDNCGIKVSRPEECFEAAADLLRNPGKADLIRHNGEKHVLNTCGWDTIVENWITMFNNT